MSSSCSPKKVLLLYRDLLRYGQKLELTDKRYFIDRIKKEFKENKELEDPSDIQFQYNKGLTLLKNKRII